MLPAPTPDSFSSRFFSLALFLGATVLCGATLAGRAEAAPPTSGGATSGSASSGSAAGSSTQGSEAVDPWDGRGAPPSDAQGETGSSGAAGTEAVPPVPVPEPPAEEPPTDPRTAYHKGNAAFREGRFTAARHYYRIALEADHSFDVLCNLGRAEAELKDNVPSYVHLTLCLEAYPKDPELSSSRAAFASLREEVQDRLTLEQNERAEVLLTEARAAPAPSAAPAATAAPAAATQSAPPEVDLGPRSPGLRMGVTLALGSLALVGVGGGIGFYVHSIDLGKQADTMREDIQDAGGDQACLGGGPAACDELNSKLAESDQAQHIALGSFIAGGALGVAAVLTYVLWPHEYGPEGSATGPSSPGRRTISHLRPSAAFDPARGSMWLGLGGRF